jgi:uncharacterized repeat protein (TIGR01451 family)
MRQVICGGVVRMVLRLTLTDRPAAALAAFMVMLAPATAQAVSFSPAANFPVDREPVSLAVGDFNGDSNADLAVAHWLSSEVSILLGTGDGSFSGPTNFSIAGSGPSNGPQSIAVADLNNDGNQDLAVINSSGGTVTNPSSDVSILLGNGDGSFSAGQDTVRAGTFPFGLAVDDFNADTLKDLAVASFGSDENCQIPPAPACPLGVSILLGAGAGIFSPPASFDADDSPISLAIGDFNDDSNADIAVANTGSNNVSILLGNGDGTFTGPTNFAVGTGPWSIAVGDYNRDSKPDLAVVSGQNLAILLGNGDGTFAGPSFLPAAGTSVAASDFDADGKLDLAVATGGRSGPVKLLLGRGDGSFTAPTSFPAGTNPHSIAVADFNRDSRPDVAVANFANPGTVSVLLNTTFADLAVSQSDSPDPVSVGQPLIYTLTVTNNGPSSASGVMLTDLLPKGVRLRAAQTDHGRCTHRAPRRIECNLGELDTGETATVNIVVRPTKPGTITNTATARASQPADPNPADNTATASTSVTP